MNLKFCFFFQGASNQSNQSNNLDQQRQELMQKRREIEERTLASSERGIGVLYESEKVKITWLNSFYYCKHNSHFL